MLSLFFPLFFYLSLLLALTIVVLICEITNSEKENVKAPNSGMQYFISHLPWLS
jgi:hypothetical protein